MHFHQGSRCVSQPRHGAQSPPAESHAAGLAETLHPGDVLALQCQLVEELQARCLVTADEIKPHELAGSNSLTKIARNCDPLHAVRIDDQGGQRQQRLVGGGHFAFAPLVTCNHLAALTPGLRYSCWHLTRSCAGSSAVRQASYSRRALAGNARIHSWGITVPVRKSAHHKPVSIRGLTPHPGLPGMMRTPMAPPSSQS